MEDIKLNGLMVQLQKAKLSQISYIHLKEIVKCLFQLTLQMIISSFFVGLNEKQSNQNLYIHLCPEFNIWLKANGTIL